MAHSGQWQELSAALNPAAPWPQAHISGPDNGKLDFPISLQALVFDGVPDGGGPFNGAIYLDDLGVGEASAVAGTGGGASAGATATPATGAPAAGAPTGLSGRIVYTSGTGVYLVDVSTGKSGQFRNFARQADMRGDGRIIWNGVGGGRDDIFTANLDGSLEQKPGKHPEDSYPSWSPSGASAVFHSTLQGDNKDRIYIHNDIGAQQEP